MLVAGPLPLTPSTGETVIEERVGPLPLLHPASAPAIITTMVNRSFFMGELHLANRVFFT